MNDKPKLIIYNRDGTTTEVEPVKLWSPCGHDEGKPCHICDAKMNNKEVDRRET